MLPFSAHKLGGKRSPPSGSMSGASDQGRAEQPESQIARTFARNSRAMLGWIFTWRDT